MMIEQEAEEGTSTSIYKWEMERMMRNMALGLVFYAARQFSDCLNEVIVTSESLAAFFFGKIRLLSCCQVGTIGTLLPG